MIYDATIPTSVTVYFDAIRRQLKITDDFVTTITKLALEANKREPGEFVEPGRTPCTSTEESENL